MAIRHKRKWKLLQWAIWGLGFKVVRGEGLPKVGVHVRVYIEGPTIMETTAYRFLRQYVHLASWAFLEVICTWEGCSFLFGKSPV